MSMTSFIYGRHTVREALTLRPEIVRTVYMRDHTDNLYPVAIKQRVKTKVLNPGSLPGDLPKDSNHQGVVAEIDQALWVVPYKHYISTLDPTPDTAVAVLGEIQDPHNVGAIIRSAAAFGVSAVLIPPHRQAGVTATVAKISAGMAFRIPLVEISNVNATIRDLQERGFWTYGLAGDEGSVSVSEERFTKPSAFVIGNEGEGLREKTRAACDTLLKIPMHPRCESLNASVAAAVTFQNWSQQHPTAIELD